MKKKAQIDAWQKFQNALLSQYNIEELAELKRSNWSGFLVGIDRLYATMYHEWDALQKDVNDIAGAVRTLEWTVVPHVKDGEEADEHAQHVANVVNEAIWKRARVPLGGYSHSFLQLVESMVHAVFRGYNAHQIEWANDGQLVYPARYVQLYPQFLQWETQSGKPDRLLLVPDGQSGQGVPFADDLFIVALNNSGPDHPLYNATFYSLVNWFLAYKFGLGWFMQFAQKYGMPKQVFRYGSEREKEALINEMEDDRVLNSIFLKGDRQYEIINPPQGGASMPQAVLVQKAEEACHKAILGQTLTSDTSAHGGSLAQAKVHAGVRAELVLQKAEFVCEILNQQLIPAIVRANFGRTEGVPMPELRCKLPQEQHTADVLNYWKTVKEMGVPFKKSEFHDSTGISMPGEGDEVYGGEQQGPLPGVEVEPQQQSEEEEDDDPEPPGGGGGGSDAVTAAKREKMDAAQAWLEPLKARLREARARGASLEEIANEAKEWRLNTVALAQSMAENVKRGLLGEASSEEVKAENPYGCNQHAHGWVGQCPYDDPPQGEEWKPPVRKKAEKKGEQTGEKAEMKEEEEKPAQKLASGELVHGRLSELFGQEMADDFENALKAAPEWVRGFYERHINEAVTKIQETRGTSCQNGTTIELNKIHLKGNEYRMKNGTLFHEIAHALDYKVTKDAGKVTWLGYNSSELHELIKKDFDEHVERFNKESVETAKKIVAQHGGKFNSAIFEAAYKNGDLSEWTYKYYKDKPGAVNQLPTQYLIALGEKGLYGKRKLVMKKIHGANRLQKHVESLGQRIDFIVSDAFRYKNGYDTGCGHSQSYYKNWNKNADAMETFANLYGAYALADEKTIKEVEKLLPRTCKRFKELVKEQ